VTSLNIANQILSHYNFDKLQERFQENPIYETTINGKKVIFVTLKIESVYSQELANFFSDAKLVVFISRHSSESGTPTLSVHTPGNLDQAELGGLPRKVSVSPANTMKYTLESMVQLKEEMQLDYDISYECTHHGPSLNVPTMFAELGSTPKEWNDSKAAEAVAHATMKAISKFGETENKAVLGIGGPHYNQKFTRIALEQKIAFGHIIPKYAIKSISAEILMQCIEKTLEKVDSVIMDWKGIKGEHKPKLIKILEEISIAYEKV